MGRTRLFTDAEFMEALTLHEFDAFKTSEALECTQATVWNHARALGIDLARERRNATRELTMPIVKAFKGTATIGQVAIQFGLTHSNAYRLLRGGIDMFWGTNPPPVWPRPDGLQELKVFHHFNEPPVDFRGWDDEDAVIAGVCGVRVRDVRAYRTRCFSMPQARVTPITQQIRDRRANPENFTAAQHQTIQEKPPAPIGSRGKASIEKRNAPTPSRVTDESRKRSI